MPLILVVARMSPHRIIQTIRARNSVTVSAYSLVAACSCQARRGTPNRSASSSDGGPGQRLSEEGESRPSSRARFTASARLCTPSLAYTLRKWVLIVLSDTNSSAAISGPRRLVGR